MSEITDTEPPLLAKVSWISLVIGHKGDLRYWEPIWRSFAARVPNLTIFVPTEVGTARLTQDLPLQPIIRLLRWVRPANRLDHYDRERNIPHPSILHALWRRRPKLVITAEFGLLTLYGVFYKHLARDCRLLLLVESDPRFPPGFWQTCRRWYRRCICRGSTLILTNNRSGRRYLEHALKVKPDKILEGVWLVSQPMEHASPACARRADDGKIRFLYVGQLIRRKGVEHLLLAFARLSEKQKRLASLTLIGDGKERAALEALVSQLGIIEWVTFTGWLPYSEIQSYYRSCHVFVFPTLCDYRALVGFEAICHGMPLIASIYDGASDEIVRNRKNGFLVDPTKDNELSAHLSFFIDNPDQLPKFSNESLRLARRFGLSGATSTLLDAARVCLGDQHLSNYARPLQKL